MLKICLNQVEVCSLYFSNGKAAKLKK